MALWAKHTSTAAGTTQAVTTFSGAFSQVTVVNRSTSTMYFTSLATQGTASDGVATSAGNHTYFLAPCASVDQPGPFSVKTFYDAVGGSQGVGTDYVTVSVFCTNTSSAYSIIAE